MHRHICEDLRLVILQPNASNGNRKEEQNSKRDKKRLAEYFPASTVQAIKYKTDSTRDTRINGKREYERKQHETRVHTDLL